MLVKICNKAFTQSNALKTHNIVHSDEKPYACKICKKAFSQRYHLNRHSKTHVKNKNSVQENGKKLDKEINQDQNINVMNDNVMNDNDGINVMNDNELKTHHASRWYLRGSDLDPGIE